ncbi:hypothetical protein VF14_08530 [Nostoc linckia z18]|uniref:Uncharacterized protein n=3 Tax=Nostoc linckia TaxID=92942 RepID=A0ABX4KPW5_NOSLI|nr:hypothetical protein VF02_12670 [Nostoc linckia z1]PHJ80668.1 hypothetical protein VF06_21985 [Nostoc linckia z4]PHJ98159.1 hypothetical protein VF04_10135 [Nostoc linckia z7]PHK35870.1 hypothetical protein VF14_08530 [Nostoc linckia z18]
MDQLEIGHGAWGMGHGAWGMGHGAWKSVGHGKVWGQRGKRFLPHPPTPPTLLIPNAQCPMPNAQCPFKIATQHCFGELNY